MSDTQNAQSSQIVSLQEYPWTTEFNKRTQAFADAIGLDVTEVLAALQDLGVEHDQKDCITILDSEEFLPASDVFKKFVDTGLAKIARVRLGLAHLRGKTDLGNANPALDGNSVADVANAIKQIADQNRPVEKWSIEELVENYDDEHPEVMQRLKDISHGRPCIILDRIKGEVRVNAKETVKMVKTARKQKTANRTLIDGKLVKVYHPGEWPVEPLDESPFLPGVTLVNGFCARSNTDWNGVDHEARQLVRIYIQHVETAKLSKKQLKEVCEDARKGVVHFRNEYQEAAIKFDELKDNDKLPKLKVSDDRETYYGRRDNGFA